MRRDSRLAMRIGCGLWIVWALVVWQVVFDRVLVLAGRQFVHTASVSARETGRYLRAGDAMRPAVRRGFWLATAAAGAILTVGLIAIPLAVRRGGSPQHKGWNPRT